MTIDCEQGDHQMVEASARIGWPLTAHLVFFQQASLK